MSPVPAPLTLGEAVAAEDRLLATLRHRRDRGRLAVAAAAAVLAHGLLLAVPIPHSSRSLPVSPVPVEATPILRWLPNPPFPAPPSAPEEAESIAAPAIRPSPEAPGEAPRGAPIPRWALEPVREPPPPVALRDLPPDAVTLLPAPRDDEGLASLLPRPFEVVRPIVIPESRVEPTFPPAAAAIRATGTVVLEVSVRADGTVSEVRAIESTRPGVGFEGAAIEAVRRWRFRPGRLGDQAVPATTLVRVEFR